jgi:hypothetical protein
MGKKILVVLILSLICYTAYNCVSEVDAAYFGVVEDRNTHAVIRILKPGYNFVRQGLMPWDISTGVYPIRYSETINIKIPIPSLEDLESELYSLKMSFSVGYEADVDSAMLSLSGMKKDKNIFRDVIEKNIRISLLKELSRYFIPVYKKSVLEKERDDFIKRVNDDVVKKSSAAGLKISRFETAGAFYIPDDSFYAEGLKYLDEIRKIERSNRKELMLLQSTVTREDIVTRKYVEKLKEISKLIKENPGLIRYIYIDKLAGNVKVLVSPDRIGMPFDSSISGDIDRGSKKSEIDNLR